MLNPTPMRIFCSILAGTILLLIAAWGSDSVGQICEYNQSTHQNDCAVHNVAIFLLIKSGEIINFYGALITALATIAIACFTYTLKKSTDRLWDASERQLGHLEDTAARELRAYIGLIRHDMNLARHEFIIVIRNDGQTPARQVKSFFNQQWYGPGHDMPDDFPFADYPQLRSGSDSVFITPGQEHPWSFELNWEKLQQFETNIIAQFYLYGRFEYLDVFGNRQESQFCYQAVRFPGGGGALRAYNRHNDCT
jgi:hypothetical protein